MVKVKEDLTGKVFGRLTVIKQVEDYIGLKGNHFANWLCKCKCGKEIEVLTVSLKNGKTKSCGCLLLETNSFVKVRENLIGKKFGNLTVLKQVEDYIYPKSKRHQSQWLCECDCESHAQVIVRGHHLTNGNIISCGCSKGISLLNDLRTKLNLKDEHGYYGIGYTSNTNKEFYFDMDDYEKIKNYCWWEYKSGDLYKGVKTYIKKHTSMKNNRNIQGKHKTMGQLIMRGNNYDHIDRDPFNNRKHNLRPSTFLENSRNCSKPKNNTSGFIGVRKIKRIKECDCWEAMIGIDKKTKHLGRFIDKKDAIRARLQAEKEYFGEFAPQRHLFKEYGIEDDFSKEK